MRFVIEYVDSVAPKDKSTTKKKLPRPFDLLEIFLNYHVIGKFHGWSYEVLLVTLHEHAPVKKKLKLKRYLDTCGEIDVRVELDSLSLVEKFRIGFDKACEAVKLISTIEVKDFKYQELLDDLEKARPLLPVTPEDLKALYAVEKTTKFAAALAHTNCCVKAWKEYPQPHTKRLIGARIYHDFEGGFLMPYVYIYTEIFSQLLCNADISTPGYKEIYFQIDSTIDRAKTFRLGTKDFYKYTYCAIDPEAYQRSSPSEKDRMVLTALCDGLRYIADFDHLDKTKIEKVIEEVSRTGIETTLPYSEKENDRYRVEVHFKVDADFKEGCSFFITMINKSTLARTVKFIARVDPWWAVYSMRKIKILKDKVEILGTGSARGESSRKAQKLPAKFEFDLKEIE